MGIRYYIWSIERKAWWMKKSWGYSKNIEDAELYSWTDAEHIFTSRNGFVNSPKVEMIAETDLKRIEETKRSIKGKK